MIEEGWKESAQKVKKKSCKLYVIARSFLCDNACRTADWLCPKENVEHMNNPTAEFNLLCPHCERDLECSEEILGMEVQCPVCSGPFTVTLPADGPQPAEERDAKEPVKHWTVDVRMLVVGSPPAYFKALVEVPKSWMLPRDKDLSEPVFATVTQAMRARYPERPVTPVEVHNADDRALKRCCEPPDYCDACCRVWLLGKTTPGL
jgi:hypothetical protein